MLNQYHLRPGDYVYLSRIFGEDELWYGGDVAVVDWSVSPPITKTQSLYIPRGYYSVLFVVDNFSEMHGPCSPVRWVTDLSRNPFSYLRPGGQGQAPYIED